MALAEIADIGATGADIERLQRALATITRRLGQRATLGSIAARCGFHLPQASWALLEYLDVRGPMRISDIAACYGVDISSVTPRLKALEGADLVARRPAPGDGRVSIIEISERGRHALGAAQAAQQSIISEALAEGSVAAPDLLGAVTLLEVLASRLDIVTLPEKGQ